MMGSDARSKLLQLLSCLPLAFVAVIYWGDTVLEQWEDIYGYGTVTDYGLPEMVMEKFRRYDSDADGYIDPYEFFAMQCEEMQWEATEKEEGRFENVTNVFEFVDEEVGEGREVIVVKAEMIPLNTSTMTKFNDMHLMVSQNVLPGLFQWKDVHSPFQAYGTKNFKVFLPPNGKLVVGEPYFIVRDTKSFTSLNRYRPPRPLPKHAIIHSILAQFHPQVFLQSRFGPIGTVAVVKAKNEDMVEVWFRIHAEYQLNSVPDYPFWFTPAQLSGRLVIDHDCQHIHLFELHLPTSHQLNVDMEWIAGPGSNEVDIGFMPLMRAVSSTSTLWKPEIEVSTAKFDEEEGHDVDISWREEITEGDSLLRLERAMYPFKKVFYHSFLDAISSAVAANKLLHLIVLWGALDDQSC